MLISSKSLREFIANRTLVSIRRANIDAFSIQGFLLALSDSLLLVQYVYDFHLDGYLLLRRADISAVKSTATDRFQAGLLQTEGILDQVDFGFQPPIQSYDVFLASRSPEEIVLLEDEISDPRRFVIGTISHLEKGIAHVRHFTGAARLTKPLEKLRVDRITSCQISTNYIQFYQRHFQRAAQSR